MKTIESAPRRLAHHHAAAIALLYGVMLLVMNGCKTTPPTTASAMDVHGEVLAFLDRWNDAIASQDRKAVRAAYVDDHRFQWFEDGTLRYQSVDEILDAMARFPPGTRIQTELSNVATDPLSDRLIYGSAVFQTHLTMPGSNFQFGGVFTMLLERTEHGLFFIRGHTSTTRPDTAR